MHALRIFLKRMAIYGKGIYHFSSSMEGRVDITALTLQLLKSVIRPAYIVPRADSLVQGRAHEVPAVATSRAFSHNVAL